MQVFKRSQVFDISATKAKVIVKAELFTLPATQNGSPHPTFHLLSQAIPTSPSLPFFTHLPALATDLTC